MKGTHTYFIAFIACLYTNASIAMDAHIDSFNTKTSTEPTVARIHEPTRFTDHVDHTDDPSGSNTTRLLHDHARSKTTDPKSTDAPVTVAPSTVEHTAPVDPTIQTTATNILSDIDGKTISESNPTTDASSTVSSKEPLTQELTDLLKKDIDPKAAEITKNITAFVSKRVDDVVTIFNKSLTAEIDAAQKTALQQRIINYIENILKSPGYTNKEQQKSLDILVTDLEALQDFSKNVDAEMQKPLPDIAYLNTLQKKALLILRSNKKIGFFNTGFRGQRLKLENTLIKTTFDVILNAEKQIFAQKTPLTDIINRGPNALKDYSFTEMLDLLEQTATNKDLDPKTKENLYNVITTTINRRNTQYIDDKSQLKATQLIQKSFNAIMTMEATAREALAIGNTPENITNLLTIKNTLIKKVTPKGKTTSPTDLTKESIDIATSALKTIETIFETTEQKISAKEPPQPQEIVSL